MEKIEAWKSEDGEFISEWASEVKAYDQKKKLQDLWNNDVGSFRFDFQNCECLADLLGALEKHKEILK